MEFGDPVLTQQPQEVQSRDRVSLRRGGREFRSDRRVEVVGLEEGKVTFESGYIGDP
jgi:hypothetical protein